MTNAKKRNTVDDDRVETRKPSKKDENPTVVVLTGDDILSEEDDRYQTRYLYLQADFDNYKKRMTTQMRDSAKWANQKLIRSLLPLLDDIERAVNVEKRSPDMDTLISGMEMLLTNFKKTLQDTGVTEINAAGKRFDPRLHEAVDRVESLDHDEGTVLEEVRKGYLFHDYCIRPSMVRVAVRPTDTSNEETNPKEKGS